MPGTALIFIPAPPAANSQTSGSNDPRASVLLNHIIRTYNPIETGQYTLEHRMLVDTSSLLNLPAGPKKITHFLTLPAQFPGSTFVGSGNARVSGSDGSKDEVSLITVPSHPVTLFPLIMQKMQSLWVPRQAHQIEAGVSLEIKDWKIRIGDLRISGGQGQGRSRGCLCELEYSGESDEAGEEDISDMAKAFLEALARGSDFKSTGMKVVGRVAGKDHQLIRQYMKMLEFARA